MAFDEPENLEKRLLSPNAVILVPDGPREKAEALLKGLPHITDREWKTEGDRPALHIQTDSPDIYSLSRAIFQAFAKGNMPLLELRVKKASLEDVFLQLTEGEPEAPEQELPAQAKKEEDKS